MVNLSGEFRVDKAIIESKEESKSTLKKNSEIIPGCGFSSRSEIWDLGFRENTASRGAKLNFSSIPTWLKPFIQDYTEYLLLVKKYSNQTIYQHLRSCINFAEFLADNRPDIVSVKQLDYHLGKTFLKSLRMRTNSNRQRALKQSNLRGFARFMHKQHPELTNTNFDFPVYYKDTSLKYIRTYSDQRMKDTPMDVIKQIMAAISIEEERLENFLSTAKSNNANQKTNAQNQLVFCQALKILIVSGRRTSHSLLIGVNPLKEPTNEEAQGVWLTWKETKSDLDEQDVFIPAPLDKEVRDAVKKVQKQREKLVKYAEEKDKDKLFLVLGFHPDGGLNAHPIRYSSLRNWLIGYESRGNWKPGFMERYNIRHEGEIFKPKLHSFRHTRFKQMRMAGAGIGIIQNDAKHLTTQMTLVYSTDNEVVAADLQKAINQKELMGYAKDLIYNKEIRLDKLSPEELKRSRENGMFIQFTEFGYCHLEIEKGICPTGNSCWIGEDGCGCKYHLTTPTFLPIIKDDLDVMLEDYEDTLRETPNSPVIGQYKALIERYEQIIQEAEEVQKGSISNG